MSTRLLCVFALAALFPVALTPARADSQAGTAVRQAYAQFDTSFKRLDADAVTALCAPDYQATDEHGKVTDLAQTKVGLATIFRVLAAPVHDVSNTLDTMHSSIQSLQVSGSTATARVVEQLDWTERGVEVPSIFQQHSLMSVDEDTWRRTQDGWKMVRSHTLRSRLSAGPVRGAQEAMDREKWQSTMDGAKQTMEFSRQMSQMRDDQFNEFMYRSHMNEIDREINRLPNHY